VQTPSPSSRPASLRAPSQAAPTKTLGSGFRNRIQQAIAKNGPSSPSPQNQGNVIARSTIPDFKTSINKTRQIIENSPRLLAGGARSANVTAQANKLSLDDAPKATSSSGSAQQGLQKQATPSLPRTQTQASRARAPQTVLANRPAGYGPFAMSEQRQAVRKKQCAAASTHAKPEVSNGDADAKGTKRMTTTSSHPDNAITIERRASRDTSQKPFTPASLLPPSRSDNRPNGNQSAIPSQQHLSSATSRPATPARMNHANAKASPRAAPVANTSQTKPVKPQSTTTTVTSTAQPLQTKEKSMRANGQPSKPPADDQVRARTDSARRSAGAPQSVQQHQKDVTATATIAKPTPHRSTVADASKLTNKPAQAGGSTSKPPVVKKPAVSALQSVLAEVSTGDSTIEAAKKNQTMAVKGVPAENSMSRDDVLKIPAGSTTSVPPKTRRDTAQSDPKATRSGTGRVGGMIAQLRSGINDSSSVGRNAASLSNSNNADVQPESVEFTKSVPTASHSRQAHPPHNPTQGPLQGSGRHSNTPVIIAQAPKMQSKGPASLPATPPALAQAQAPESLQTRPPFPVQKSTGRSSDATAAAASRPAKTHTRVPSGPTEDGFDIYIPPAPGTSNAVPPPTRGDDVAAAPATSGRTGGEASEPNSELAVADGLSSARAGQHVSYSASTPASKNRTDVAATTPVHRQNPLTSRMVGAGKAAPKLTSRDTPDVPASSDSSGCGPGATPAVVIPSTKTPRHAVAVAEPRVPLAATQKTKLNEVSYTLRPFQAPSRKI
jgi:hypothetical protein